MVSYRRCLEFNEWEAIRKRLLELRDKEGSLLMQKADADVAVRSLVHMSFQNRVVIFYENDEFIGILAFDVGSVWWANLITLEEDLVLCVSPTFKGFGRIAVDKLKELAKEYKAQLIVSGSIFQENPAIIANLYKKKGFKQSCPVFVWWGDED